MKKNNRLVFFNEKFVPESEAKISIYDSALMFGDMVFEMTRSFKGKQSLLEKHIDKIASLGRDILLKDDKIQRLEEAKKDMKERYNELTEDFREQQRWNRQPKNWN